MTAAAPGIPSRFGHIAVKNERRKVLRPVPPCRRCRKPLKVWGYGSEYGSRSVSPGYALACNHCNEDFDTSEQERRVGYWYPYRPSKDQAPFDEFHYRAYWAGGHDHFEGYVRVDASDEKPMGILTEKQFRRRAVEIVMRHAVGLDYKKELVLKRAPHLDFHPVFETQILHEGDSPLVEDGFWSPENETDPAHAFFMSWLQRHDFAHYERNFGGTDFGGMLYGARPSRGGE